MKRSGRTLKFAEVSGTGNAIDWVTKNWPVIAMLAILAASAVFFGWLLSRPPPAPPYP